MNFYLAIIAVIVFVLVLIFFDRGQAPRASDLMEKESVKFGGRVERSPIGRAVGFKFSYLTKDVHVKRETFGGTAYIGSLLTDVSLIGYKGANFWIFKRNFSLLNPAQFLITAFSGLIPLTVKTGNELFDKTFVIKSKDKGSINSLFDRDMQSYLMLYGCSDLSIIAKAKNLRISTWNIGEKEKDYDFIISVALKIVDRFKDLNYFI